jgi:hypothetical protein
MDTRTKLVQISHSEKETKKSHQCPSSIVNYSSGVTTGSHGFTLETLVEAG